MSYLYIGSFGSYLMLGVNVLATRKIHFDSTHHMNSHNLLLTVSDIVALALADISVLLAVHV